MQKIRLGISACLLGEPVRFDGGHKFDRFITDTLGQYVEFVPVCPKAECGLGIPREAMRLVGAPQSPRLVTVRTLVGSYGTDDSAWARQRVVQLEQEDLCGFIFKSELTQQRHGAGESLRGSRACRKSMVWAFLPRIFMEHFPLACRWKTKGGSMTPRFAKISSSDLCH